jgi:hypothetical protein
MLSRFARFNDLLIDRNSATRGDEIRRMRRRGDFIGALLAVLLSRVSRTLGSAPVGWIRVCDGQLADDNGNRFVISGWNG